MRFLEIVLEKLYWDLIEFKVLPELSGHECQVNSVKFTRSKKFAASEGLDKKVLMWDLENVELYATFWGHLDYINKVMITEDDENVVSENITDGIRVWNIANKKQVFEFKDLNESKEWLLKIKMLRLNSVSYYFKSNIVLLYKHNLVIEYILSFTNLHQY